MLVFLDTEFTDFTRPDLISLALVSDDGREFYAERSDYDRSKCNAFVIETVLPLLGRVPGAACTGAQITKRLRAWFEALPEPATLIYDYEGDWLLLTNAILGRPHTKPPDNFGEPLHLDRSTITHPEFDTALNRVFTRQWPPHHALADARALMAGYRAWRVFMEPQKGIQ